VAVRRGEAVHVGEKVEVAVLTAVGVRLAVEVAVRVRVQVAVAVEEGRVVAVRVGVAVETARVVQVGVGVRVGQVVAVGVIDEGMETVAVAVGKTGPVGPLETLRIQALVPMRNPKVKARQREGRMGFLLRGMIQAGLSSWEGTLL
jgi:hypothetical protein